MELEYGLGLFRKFSKIKGSGQGTDHQGRTEQRIEKLESGLVDFGIIESAEIQFEIYYGLISRLFLSPDESPFVAKSLRTLYQKMNEDDRKVALEGIKHIIKTNRAPNRKGQATEKTLSTKETTGLKELVRIMQENQSDEFIFDFLGWFFTRTF